MDNDTPGAEPLRSAPGYAALQLAAALRTNTDHPDPQVRERARVKARQWEKVMAGTFTGSIEVGSRTPLAGVPAWVTPDVVKGGFATGEFKAGSALLDHELQTLAAAGMVPSADARRWLNARLLTDDGMAGLYALLDSGCYDVNVPEEGALLVVAWLTRHGKADAAREVLGAIAPWFDRLRFFPAPAAQARRFGERLFLNPVRDVALALNKRRAPNRRIMTQRETVRVLPLYDRAVQLFIDSVEGEPPSIDIDASGAWRDAASGKFRIAGGWPCRHYPAQWHARGEALLHEWVGHSVARRKDDSVAQLLDYLRICVMEPATLTGRDVGRIRLILARYIGKRGLPGSARCAALRSEQARQVRGVPHHLLAGVLAERLRAYPQEGGIDDLAPLGVTVTAAEAANLGEGAGCAIPSSLLAKLQRCHIDTIAALVERGVVRSAEALGCVLPQLSAAINGAAIEDPSLKHLYGALYQAFRRRRSLLLQNLEHQVQLHELPWLAAVNAERQHGLQPRTLARRTLEEITVLTLTSFPHTMIPNPLLQEMSALAANAGLDLPLVDELAADIFEGAFSPKFTKVAAHATALLDDSLYCRYYGIDVRQRGRLRELVKPAKATGKASSDKKELLHLCEERAGIPYGNGRVAGNAMIIEQQQILTTQNLATLVSSLGLVDELRPRFYGMAQQCFEWICRDQQVRRDNSHAELRAVKNAAYAWRQMIFFLSLAPAPATAELIAWAHAHLGPQSRRLRKRLAPAMAGLELAAAYRSLDEPAIVASGARRLLGYSCTPHWMLAM
ncbi:hypothetical protein [Massilia pseudoviolaceinigra]|uniref:hypothetical protein n=1 Tax=Massilia pseudoviolaceinigra TaxID=3057165 RepID=UPI00279666FC|nr:hypothetical protein [Massilia sp. CCM 9206]MDQ1923329.1 hypothetical protein [Massilia sp. CCM 9206]